MRLIGEGSLGLVGKPRPGFDGWDIHLGCLCLACCSIACRVSGGQDGRREVSEWMAWAAESGGIPSAAVE